MNTTRTSFLRPLHSTGIGLLLASSLLNAPAQGFLQGLLDTVAQPAQGKTTVTQQQVRDLPPYNGPKHRIAVAGFEVRGYGHGQLATGLRETLNSALIQTGYFEVLDRSDWSADNAERDSGNFDEIARADFQIFGHVNAVETTTRSGGGIDPNDLLRKVTGQNLPSIQMGGKTAVIKMTLKIVNARTGAGLYSQDIEATSRDSSFRIKGLPGFTHAGTDQDNPVNRAAMQAVYEMVRLTCDFMSKQKLGPALPAKVAAQVVDVDREDEAIFINAGANQGVKKNMEFALINKHGFAKKGFVARVVDVQADKAMLEVVEGELPATGVSLCAK